MELAQKHFCGVIQSEITTAKRENPGGRGVGHGFSGSGDSLAEGPANLMIIQAKDTLQ